LCELAARFLSIPVAIVALEQNFSATRDVTTIDGPVVTKECRDVDLFTRYSHKNQLSSLIFVLLLLFVPFASKFDFWLISQFIVLHRNIVLQILALHFTLHCIPTFSTYVDYEIDQWNDQKTKASDITFEVYGKF
jgi:hypothetical protein